MAWPFERSRTSDNAAAAVRVRGAGRARGAFHRGLISRHKLEPTWTPVLEAVLDCALGPWRNVIVTGDTSRAVLELVVGHIGSGLRILAIRT